MPLETHTVKNARVDLACHHLADGPGTPLLLLHALHGSTVDWSSEIAWAGPVHALDFSGHGASGHVRGGGYTPELFVADADAALSSVAARHGEAAGLVIAGAGLGAYVALLLAGARAELVRGALLGPGAGLGENDGEPDFDRPPERLRPRGDVPDECDPSLWRFIGEIKPRDYVASFAARAQRLWMLDDGGFRPTWWHVARDAPGAESIGPDWSTGFAALARLG